MAEAISHVPSTFVHRGVKWQLTREGILSTSLRCDSS